MPEKRKTIRLKDYDYTQAGAYCITVCVNDYKCLFGKVIDETMVLNECGKMIQKWWQEIPKKYGGIEIDETIIMPNHLHGIIKIVGAGSKPALKHNHIFHNVDNTTNTRAGLEPAPTPTIGTVIQWFKTMSTNEYIRNVKTKHWSPYNTRLWQRNYYEHVIRNEFELTRTREYIMNNSIRWKNM